MTQGGELIHVAKRMPLEGAPEEVEGAIECTEGVVDATVRDSASDGQLSPRIRAEVEAVQVEHVAELAHESTKHVQQGAAHECHGVPYALLRRLAKRLQLQGSE